jgi:hypothetical protein
VREILLKELVFVATSSFVVATTFVVAVAGLGEE